MSRARNMEDPDRETERELEAVIRDAGREWVEEAAEDERLTELLRRRRLSLADLALDWVHRGQRVRAEMGSNTFTGKVVDAGTDYLSLERTEDLVTLRLTGATFTLEPEPGDGRDQAGATSSLKAVLAEAEANQQLVRVITADGRALVGTIAVVASDHLEVRQDHLTVMVPLETAMAVIATGPWS